MQSNTCTLLLFFAVRTVGCDSGVFNGRHYPGLSLITLPPLETTSEPIHADGLSELQDRQENAPEAFLRRLKGIEQPSLIPLLHTKNLDMIYRQMYRNGKAVFPVSAMKQGSHSQRNNIHSNDILSPRLGSEEFLIMMDNVNIRSLVFFNKFECKTLNPC